MISDAPIFDALKPIREIEARTLDDMRPAMAEDQPFVVRGLVSDWPLVRAGLRSGREARAYLLSKALQKPFVVNVGPPETNGRMFYREDMSMNVSMGRAPLREIFDRIDANEAAPSAPVVYMSSIGVKTFFDGLHEDNHVAFGDQDVLESIWIGTRTRVAAHNDFPDNLACVAVGQRRFTLFPPSEFRNLYIGPVDNTPAGRAISMVDFHAPDFERFPKFRQAMQAGMTATLSPGDAIFMPSMWWHHVEGLSPFNVLVNYWWRETPRYLGGPQNALNHAIMAIRDLPAHERAHWRDMFDYYVFENGPEVTAHIPEKGRGILGPMDAALAGRIRNFLIKMLNDE